jgi:hypothetical protein
LLKGTTLYFEDNLSSMVNFPWLVLEQNGRVVFPSRHLLVKNVSSNVIVDYGGPI